MTKLIKPQDIHDYLTYEPETGLFYWKALNSKLNDSGDRLREVNRWNTRYAGQPAMHTPGKKRYLTGQLCGRTYFAHRVAWAMLYLRWPVCQIDHINRDPTDNRIENLREADNAQNQMNAGSLGGTSNYCGVSLRPNGKWCAQISANGKKHHVGIYHSERAAAKAYDAMAIKLHGSFAFLNFPHKNTHFGETA